MEENIIRCPCGLHGRTAIGLHQLAGSLPCLVFVEKINIGRKVDCSSLIGVLSLGVEPGDEIKINIVNGEQDSNYSKIVEFLNSQL